MTQSDWDESRNEVMQALGRIEARQEAAHERHVQILQKLEGVEHRVNHLESAKSWVLGAAAAVSTVVTFIVSTLHLK